MSSDPLVDWRRVVLAGIGAMLAVVAGLAGCSSDSGDDGAATSSSSPSQAASAESGAPAEDVCAAAATAQSSLEALVGTSIVREGTDTLRERFSSFESDVQLLLESGQAELAPETAAVRAAVATLQGALSGLQQDPTAADAALIKPSLQAVKTSTDELIVAIRSAC
jgi:hypothetical protein